MAKSPFDYFRKYTGAMMVALVVLLMVAFGLQDILGTGGGGPARDPQAGETAVSWEGGKLTKGELNGLVTRRQILASFLSDVYRSGIMTARAEGNPDPRPPVQPLRLPSTDDQGVRQDVVLTKIYAEAARDAGIVVSDETIRDYLTDLGLRKVSKDEMRNMLASMRVGDRGSVTIDFIFDMLRDAMLSRNFLNSYLYNFNTTVPQQRWSDWLEVEDKVIVEAAALRAEDFVSKVEDPTDEQLQAFYDEHKERVYSPDFLGGVELPSPTPGFKTPRRITLQYAKADYSKVIDGLLDSVTKEEIAEYYDDNRDKFVKAADLLGDNLLGDDEVGGLEEAPPEEAGDSEADTEEPATEESADESAEGSESPAPTDSGAATKASPFRLVALQEEGAEEAAAEEAAEASEDADATAEEAGDSDSDSEEAGDEVSDDEAAGDDEEDEIEYQPLEEVEDDIRRTLAEEKARSVQRDRMAELIAPLKSAYDDFIVAKINAGETGATDEGGDADSKIEPAEVLTNLETFAEENELEFAKTADLSLLELRGSTIGRTVDPNRLDPRFQNTQGRGRLMPLWLRMIGDDKLKVYEPVVTYDSDSNGYVVVATLDEEERVPPLEEVKDEVVKAWKLKEAAKLALKRAEEIAKEAEPEGLSLKDFLAGEPNIKVEETDAFARFTALQYAPATSRIPIRLSTPEPIEAAGPDFMDAVFDLEPGKIGAVLNHDETVAYVVRSQHFESTSELRDRYLEMGELQYMLYGFGEGNRRELNNALVKSLLGDSPLEWAEDEEAGNEG